MADCHGRLDAREGLDEAPPPIPENAPAEGRPQRWGFTERAAILTCTPVLPCWRRFTTASLTLG
jgi:hypothetical protein